MPEEATGPRLLRLPAFVDDRGSLVATEGSATMPFAATRYFAIHDIQPNATRGGHARRIGHELITCVKGSCVAEVRSTMGRAEFALSDPGIALHVPPQHWVECREFSADAVLVVLCSEPYDPDDLLEEDGVTTDNGMKG